MLAPPLLRYEYTDKEAQEKVIRASDLEWVIVRPMLLINGSWTNAYRAWVEVKTGPPSLHFAGIVADFLMRQLTDDAFIHTTPAIGY